MDIFKHHNEVTVMFRKKTFGFGSKLSQLEDSIERLASEPIRELSIDEIALVVGGSEGPAF